MEANMANFWTESRHELKSFVYRRVKDNALAEDIVQDVFIKMHTKIGQLKEAHKMKSWIYQITRNTIYDHYRAKSKTIDFSDLDWESDPQELNNCVASCLGDMLTTLPPKYKEALELTEIDNLSQTELSERLHISYSGAKSRVQRARQMLKERMEKQYNIKTDSYGNVVVCEDRSPCNCPASFSEQ